METKLKEDVFEEEFSHSFGIYSFSTRGENYPLRKTVVNHDQKRIIAMRHSQSLLAANEWSYVSAPKLQCVYTLSLLHLVHHHLYLTSKGLKVG